METSLPSNIPHGMTPKKLRWLIRRYNAGRVLHGTALLAAAAVFWIVTFYLAVSFARLVWPNVSDPVFWLIVAVFPSLVVWVGFFHGALFFTVRTDPDLRSVRGVSTMEWLDPSWTTLFLAVVCLAPILTSLAAAAFRERLAVGPARLHLAVTLFDYLGDWGDWVPYPKFESQRQAMILLARLDLVRISRRFGKHQVKLVGGMPKWKREVSTTAQRLR